MQENVPSDQTDHALLAYKIFMNTHPLGIMVGMFTRPVTGLGMPSTMGITFPAEHEEEHKN